MTQEEKSLLLKDLWARLPYGVIMTNKMLTETYYPLDGNEWQAAYYDDDWDDVPYLRPMSSMTEEEEEELRLLKNQLVDCDETNDEKFYGIISEIHNLYLLYHIDFMGLIPKGLALEAPKNMYNHG